MLLILDKLFIDIIKENNDVSNNLEEYLNKYYSSNNLNKQEKGLYIELKNDIINLYKNIYLYFYKDEIFNENINIIIYCLSII